MANVSTQSRRNPGGAYCFVMGCHNSFYLQRPAGVSFHRIPISNNRGHWLAAIGRVEEETCIVQHVCSEHFLVDDFWHGGVRKLLKRHAVPTVNLPPADTQPERPEQIECSPDVMLPSPTNNLLSHRCSPEAMLPSRTNTLFNLPTTSNWSLGSGSTSSPVRNMKRAIVLDHSYSSSPRHQGKQIEHLTRRVDKYRQKLKSSRRTSTRRKVAISHLKDVVKDLRRKHFLSSTALEQIEQCFHGIPQAIMKRMLKNNKSKKLTREAYPPELKRFAMTLQFYSDKAYRYVRRVFDLCLPAESTIRAWLSKVDCSPGFTKPSLTAIRIKAEQHLQKHNRPLMCSLLLDEMSIKKEVSVEPATLITRGYVDFGCEVEYRGESELATEALVLMVVGVNENFKLPIAYFFMNKINGPEKANIVREALRHLHPTGAKVLALTCDGPKIHFAMMAELGCQVRNVANIIPFFQHPVDTTQEVMVFFDVCHMLKLVRNNWEKLKQFKDPEGNIIDWRYITNLHELQESEGLVLANKLRKKHVQFRKAIMKVNLAAQTLSSSVADALEFLKTDLRMVQFENSTPTIKFIRLIDGLFDLMNSRSSFGKAFKTPLRPQNEHYWMPLLLNGMDYLKACRTLDDRLLVSTVNQTPFLGFIVSISSALQLYEKQVQSGHLDYLLTYKFSQDHLELFFCSIRSRNGWIVNPNCLQFMRTYKRLLVHNDIRDVSGNCVAQDQTHILTMSSTKNDTSILLDETEIAYRRLKTDELIENIDEKMVVNIPSVPVNSEYAENVVAYICGYVIRMYKRHSACPACLEALLLDSEENADVALKFIKRKSRGGLLLPSRDLRELCLKTEQKIKHIFTILDNKLPGQDICLQLLMKDVDGYYENRRFFRCLDDHVMEQEIYAVSHQKKLIEFVIKSYAKIRLNSLSKTINEFSGIGSRQVLSRLLIFKHL